MGSGGRALDRAAEYTGVIHLLVTDVIMPDMNGRRLANAMATAMPSIKVLFVSGYTADIIGHHGVLDEGVAFLAKPYSRRSLLARVRQMLDDASPWSDTPSSHDAGSDPTRAC